MMLGVTLVSIVLNLIALMPAYSAGIFFTAHDIKGIAVLQKNKERFVDLQKQKEILEHLNLGKLNKERALFDLPLAPLPHLIHPLALHRFNGQSIQVIPLGMRDNEICFKVMGLEQEPFFLYAPSSTLLTNYDI
jgi:hypothetical protein